MTVSNAKAQRGEEDSTAEAQGNLTSRDLADFMLFFAKFEYALSRAGYVKSGKRKVNGKADLQPCGADWDGFIKDLTVKNKNFFDSMKKEYEEIFKDGGPKVWACKKNKKPKFHSDTKISDTKTLIYACKHIRNNLIHGEKFETDKENVARNHRLLSDAKKILMSALREVPAKGTNIPASDIFYSIVYRTEENE